MIRASLKQSRHGPFASIVYSVSAQAVSISYRPSVFSRSHLSASRLLMTPAIATAPLRPRTANPFSQPYLSSRLPASASVQMRSYIFLPDSLKDIYRQMRALIHDSSRQYKTQLKVKLRNRWQDTLGFQRQLQQLLQIQRARQFLRRKVSTDASRVVDDNFAARNFTSAYKLSVKRSASDSVRYVRRNMREVWLKNRKKLEAMSLPSAYQSSAFKSSAAWSQGKRFLTAHFNAKRRVLARRRLARQLAQWKQSCLDLNENMNGNFNSKASSDAQSGNKRGNRNSTWMGITLTEPAQHSWFDSEGYPLTSRDPETGRFVNPWMSQSSNGENGLKKFLRWKLGPICRFFIRRGHERTHSLSVSNIKSNNVKASSFTFDPLSKIDASTQKYPFHSALPQSSLHGDQWHSQSHVTDNFQYQLPKCSSTTSFQYSPSLDNSTSYFTAASDSGDDQTTHHLKCANDKPSSNSQQFQQKTIELTWIGHASTLVVLPGNFAILTDPHFSYYAGPVRRNTPPGLNVADLPEFVDAVLISHDHMDHLDYWSVLQLIDANKVKYWIVPLGIKVWLMDQAGVSPEDIIELEWWEGVRITKEMCGRIDADPILPRVERLVRASDSSYNNTNKQHRKSVATNKSEMIVTCAPAQHWCSRTPFDRNRRLWCSWAVHATPCREPLTSAEKDSSYQNSPQTHSFYFAGDTGLPPDFPLHHQIGDRLGPFDLSAIPIGAYEPEWFMREAHCNPAEAVKIHQALRSRRSVAVHFDTFNLADEPREEPPALLLAEVERVNKKITEVATEAIAVADEVEIVTRSGNPERKLSKINAEMIETLSLSRECDMSKGPGRRFVEMLPPLVDFVVIKQGEVIKSAPKQ